VLSIIGEHQEKESLSNTMERSKMSAPREAALSSFAAPSTGNRSMSKSSHVRVVARIRPMNDQEQQHGIAALQPIVPEQAMSPQKENLPQQQQHSSPPRAARKGPFKFLTPSRKKNKPASSSTPQRAANDATPVIRNGQNHLTAPSPGRPPVSSSLHVESYGTAKSLSAQHKVFDLDAVFAPQASQKEVYDRSVGDAVRRNIFSGYNTTIIAYGQTGSGKTYTMGGKREADLANSMEACSPTNSNSSSKSLVGMLKTSSSKSVNSASEDTSAQESSSFTIEEEDGIIPRAVHDLFKAKQRHESAGEVSIQLTYLEIYNDELRDLLVDGGDEPENLKLCDHGDDGIVVKGLTCVTVKSTATVKQLMESAAKRRTTASTRMNMRSSRSHAICSLLVTINPATQTGSNQSSSMSTRAEVITGKLTLVDLAGSERIKETGVSGIHQQESININKDLFVLGKVISSLAEKTKASRSKVHVPYRDSKLTRLLRDSLGGNCCTVMVACVSPTQKNLDESINTLRYAERTRTITNAVKQNVFKAAMTPAECAAMRGENKMLKSKVQELVKRIQLLEQKMGDADGLSLASNFTMDDLSLGASIEEREPIKVESTVTESTSTAKTDSTKDELVSDAQWDAKNLALMSLDLEISEKKEIVKKLRAETTELEAALISAKTESGPLQDSSPSVGAPSLGATAAPGTRIEMVTMSNATAHDGALEQQSRQHAMAIRVLEAKVQSLIEVNGGLRKELSSQRQQMELNQEEEKDNKEKIEALILQLEFEQKRIAEHESSLRKTQQELSQAVEERDGYRMKIAIQADEIAKRETEMAAMKKQLEEIGQLRFALSFSEQQVEELRKAAREKENQSLAHSIAQGEAESNPKGVLTAHNINVEVTHQQNESHKATESKNLPNEDDGAISANPVDCDSSFDTAGQDSEGSDHKAIRLQAAKMLFFANKAIERGRDSRSVCSSLASSNGTELKPEMTKIRTMLNERTSSAPPLPSGKPPVPGKPPRAVGSKRSPVKASPVIPNEDGPVISNLDQISSMNECLCSKDPEYVNFFLPKLGATCSCGLNDANNVSMTEGDDPLALASILREWQVDFLDSVDIHTAKELVQVYNLKGGLLAKEMRKWRRKQRLASVKTASCAIALHIWTRTCKAVIKSVQKQIAEGAKIVKRPAILEVAWTSDNNTAVSSLGSSLAEF
jgi:hypothetical protein